MDWILIEMYVYTYTIQIHQKSLYLWIGFSNCYVCVHVKLDKYNPDVN